LWRSLSIRCTCTPHARRCCRAVMTTELKLMLEVIEGGGLE
jgi:hypothetical protein